MPLIQIDGPQLEIEKKRDLVKRITDVAMDVYKIEHITILIRENTAENVGVNGQLIADMHKEH
ncbi:MAG: 4-oxalocrotonate tautomerase [Candidatus Cloacimonadota bacterium]|nr:MAG: 4-oxalocrotonate tautomerase [Candidatus Cloacimonadota bacterium]